MALIDTILSQIISAKYGREVRQAIHDGIQQCYADAIIGIKGDQGTSITSVARTSGNGAEGTTDIYTITFSNNTSSTFQVRHGSKGSTGLTGDKGDKGDKGDTITSIIRTAGNGAEGTVDTYTITMSSGDTSTFQVRNGSKGSTGDTGPKGDKGEQGVSITNIVRTSGTGAEGTTDVYTITLSNGVQSTFNVRNGSKGNQGIQGPIGNTGATGPKGDPGVSITNIVRTSGTGEEGTTDIYTIYLSSGASQTFTVKHGSRGPVGATGVGIRDVRKISGTGAEGTVDTYAVMLSDGENKNFDVRHGSKGSTGSKGDPGKGVVGINKVSGTGAPGSVDTYAISYTDGSVTNFNVYNGADGAGSPTAQKLANARALTIGAVSKLFDGSEDVTWSLEELDLAQRLHTHTTLEITDFPTEMPASDVYEWAKAQTKPTYTPTEVGAASEFHNHTTSDITNFPSSMPASDVEAWAKALTKPSYTPAEVGAAPALHNHTTGSITDFPETMPPSPHAHSTNDITDFPTEMPASDVSAWAKEAIKPTYTPSEVGAAEEIHNHSIEAITDLRVGGTNLFLDSMVEVSSSDYTIYSQTVTGLEAGQEYTLSFCGCSTIESATLLVAMYDNSWTDLIDPRPTVGPLAYPIVVTKTFTATSGVASFYAYSSPSGNGGAVYLKWIKLEKGNIATDWSPAPQDIRFRQNILHNWDFRNPVNQRGVSNITASVYQYVIDRWAISAETSLSVNASSVSVSAGGTIQQIIEGDLLAGERVTTSIEEADGTIRAVTGAFPLESGGISSLVMPGFGVVRLSIYAGNAVCALIPSQAFAISRVKLEIGSLSTLHLDPPMDWAVELPKCYRYFFKIPRWFKMVVFTTEAGTIAYFNVPVRMRTTPSSNIGTINVFNGTSTNVVKTPTSLSMADTKIEIQCGDNSGLTAFLIYHGELGNSQGMYLSADL